MNKPTLQRINFNSLTARQKENHNFHKAAAILADYGFNCIRLSDDWKGTDFIACHIDGTSLKVQLKSRLTIDRKYCGKDIWMMFPDGDRWYLVRHDQLVRIVGETTPALNNNSWQLQDRCHWGRPPRKLIESLKEFAL